MARVLKTFPHAAKGRKALYPWAEWLDGQAWLLTKGVDFVTEPDHFRATAFQAAKRNGLKIRTATVAVKNIAIQAYTP